VLYVTGVLAIVYGLLFGGPLGADGISWGTVMFGLGLWGISAAWSALLMLRYGTQCAPGASPVRVEDRKPLDRARKGKGR
jgi:hypothetical protein